MRPRPRPALAMSLPHAHLKVLDKGESAHWDEADFEKNNVSGWQQGTGIAVDQFVDHVITMK